MSNELAIATVSAVLRARIQSMINASGTSGFECFTAPPADDSKAGVYLHLYHVLPNAELRNQHLPEHGPNGTVVHPSRLAVDLYYLASFVGAAATHDAERLAGRVLAGLAQASRLSNEEITEFVGDLAAGDPLTGSDLGDQIEAVRITMLPLDLEELSRLWAMYGQTKHRLSVAYRVSVVMLDAQAPRVPSLPVTQVPAIAVFPIRAPRLTAVRSAARDQPVVQFGERIVVRGSALRGDRTQLRIGGSSTTPPAGAVTDEEIGLAFDAASGLRAGVAAVRVVHRIVLADGSTREGAGSNALPVALVPTVAPAAGGPVPAGTVRLTVTPVPAADERVALLLTGTAGQGSSTWTAWKVASGVVEFATTGLAGGSYLARVDVGGAASLLVTDAVTGAFTGPVVSLP